MREREREREKLNPIRPSFISSKLFPLQLNNLTTYLRKTSNFCKFNCVLPIMSLPKEMLYII